MLLPAGWFHCDNFVHAWVKHTQTAKLHNLLVIAGLLSQPNVKSPATQREKVLQPF
ncbi:hypothetical protein PT974_01216 [Cladobotryum mycophilum]|uniref:Uncharacterized protein n=1 Tax=Cladobotryum mycophilum TaxID=491253 RepID=A0ABR0T315_9HYPO